jgi:hypothetical protein
MKRRESLGTRLNFSLLRKMWQSRNQSPQSSASLHWGLQALVSRLKMWTFHFIQLFCIGSNPWLKYFWSALDFIQVLQLL